MVGVIPPGEEEEGSSELYKAHHSEQWPGVHMWKY